MVGEEMGGGRHAGQGEARGMQSGGHRGENEEDTQGRTSQSTCKRQASCAPVSMLLLALFSC